MIPFCLSLLLLLLVVALDQKMRHPLHALLMAISVPFMFIIHHYRVHI